jgi:hypothetical protein
VSNPTEHPAALSPEVIDLLAAVRDALDCTGLDSAGRIYRTVQVQVRLDGILTTARIDAEHPDLPPLVSRAITDAVAALRQD